MLRFFEVPTGTGGVLSCSACGGTPEAGGGGARYLSVEEIESSVRTVVGAWPGGAGSNVSLVGPEPLGHPRIFEALKAASQAGVSRLRVQTCGRGLAEEAVCRKFLESGVRHLRLVLLAGESDSHDRLAGECGLFGAMEAGAAAFTRTAEGLDLAVALSVLVPVCPHNLRQLPEAVTTAARLGAATVTLRFEEGLSRDTSSAAWSRAACDTGTVNTVWVELQGDAPKLPEGYELHLTAVGESLRVPDSGGVPAAECPDREGEDR